MRGSREELCTLEIELDLCRCMIGVEATKEGSEDAVGEHSKDLDSLGLSPCTSGVDLCLVSYCHVALKNLTNRIFQLKIRCPQWSFSSLWPVANAYFSYSVHGYPFSRYK